jgi:hypothetical protein
MRTILYTLFLAYLQHSTMYSIPQADCLNSRALGNHLKVSCHDSCDDWPDIIGTDAQSDSLRKSAFTECLCWMEEEGASKYVGGHVNRVVSMIIARIA